MINGERQLVSEKENAGYWSFNSDDGVGYVEVEIDGNLYGDNFWYEIREAFYIWIDFGTSANAYTIIQNRRSKQIWERASGDGPNGGELVVRYELELR